MPLLRPPTSTAISLCWAELAYSLCTSKGRDGDTDHIKYNTVQQIHSGTVWYHTHCRYGNDHAGPGHAGSVQERHGHALYVSSTNEPVMYFAHTGMSKHNMGTETQKSWALSHVHIAFMDLELDHPPFLGESTEV
jgi:hypothetical protein